MNINRFLIVQIADIGDLVLSTPALASLRERYPHAHIAVLTTPHAAPILQHTNLADEILTIPRWLRATQPQSAAALFALARRLRAGQYDAILYFHHFSTRAGALKHAAITAAAGSPIRAGLDNGKAPFLTHRLPDRGFGALHQAQYWLNLVGLFGASSEPRPAIIGRSDADRAWAIARLPDENYVAIHAGGGSYNTARRWDADKFADVAQRLAADGAKIVLVGGKGDNNEAVAAQLDVPPIDLTGQTTLNQLAAALARCGRFIGAESGVMHIAAAAGCAVTAVFGAGNHDAWRPWTPTGHSLVVRSGVRCSPCAYIGTGVGARDGCAARTCMKLVTVEDVPSPHPPTPSPLHGEGESLHGVPPLHAVERGLGGEVKARHEVKARAERGLGGEVKARGERQIPILTYPISRLTYAEWLDRIDAWMQSGGLHHVVTLNPEMIMIARRDPVFDVVVRRADVTLPDGIGLLLAAKWRGTPLPERVTGSDGVPKIAERAAAQGWRLFLLGAADGIAQQAADALQRRYPGVKIVGVYAGSPSADDEDEIVARVNAANADILFVAYGAPEQDKWIARNSVRLNVKMAIGVGGAFDFIAGVVPRAPEAWRHAGVEWLYRLIKQPWRWKRMLRLPRFLLAVMLEQPHPRRTERDSPAPHGEG
ncbi:MAG: WecB/TagA/CpsF family glycosyltransferase [Chloroflexota bacterium]|nr:WecB/TagA/CpsF family glycosyltransferase [Chloroflexota bacterium]